MTKKVSKQNILDTDKLLQAKWSNKHSFIEPFPQVETNKINQKQNKTKTKRQDVAMYRSDKMKKKNKTANHTVSSKLIRELDNEL